MVDRLSNLLHRLLPMNLYGFENAIQTELLAASRTCFEYPVTEQQKNVLVLKD